MTDQDFTDIDGKRWFTNDALVKQVKSGELTETEAYNYQRRRDKEEIKWEIRQENEKEKKTSTEKEERAKDAENVLKQYPHFAKDHPDFNPADPLYKLATDIWNEGYRANPKGLSLALKRAKEILRISDTNIDRSDDLSIETGNPPDKRREKTSEVILTEYEKETAIRQFTNAINPKSGSFYTEKEALEKALNGKKQRLATQKG